MRASQRRAFSIAHDPMGQRERRSRYVPRTVLSCPFYGVPPSSPGYRDAGFYDSAVTCLWGVGYR